MVKLVKLILFTLFCSSIGAQAAYTLIATSDGTFTTAATWGLCNATAESDSEAANTAVTTSWQNSSSFIPGEITVDGIAVKVATRAASPSGTFSIALTNITDASAVDSVTINVSDIAQTGGTTAYNHGWKFFKFSTPRALTAGKSYAVAAITSSSSQVNLYSAASANWSRELRTTATQAPAVGDKLIIVGEMTGAGAITARTVTLDNTATTVFGSTSYPQSISISGGGTLALASTASTAFLLPFAGILHGAEGGVLDTSAVASTSSITFTNANTASVDGGFYFGNGFTSKLVGATKFPWTFLAADMSIGSTNVTTSDSTGWAIGDSIVLSATGTTYTQHDSNVVSTVSGTAITLPYGSGVTYAHSGTAPYKAEVINLTRNVLLRGTSGTLCSYIYCDATSTNAWTNSAFAFMGSSTTGKKGVDIACSAADRFIADRCAFRNFPADSAIVLNCAASTYSVINSNVFFGNALSAISLGAGGGHKVGSNCSIYNTRGGAAYAAYINSATAVFTNNYISGSVGFGVNIVDSLFTDWGTAVFNDNVIHSVATRAIEVSVSYNLPIMRAFVWRNNHGIEILSQAAKTTIRDSIIEQNGAGIVTFGDDVVITNCTLNSGATFQQSLGVVKYGGQRNTVINSTFGNITPHQGADLRCGGYTGGYFGSGSLELLNTTLNSPVQIFTTGSGKSTYCLSKRHNGVAGDNRFWFRNGSGLSDSTAAHVRSGVSMKLIPSSAGEKIYPPPNFGFLVAVPSGASRAVSVWVRKSDATGGDVAYNGNQPRLILLADVSLGLNTDTILATATASNGTWEKLTGTISGTTASGVCRLWVDCDGTAGFINVDEFSAQSDTTQRFDYAPCVWGSSGGYQSNVSVQ